MHTFDGKWTYRSFCPRPGAREKGTKAQIAAPWTPVGELHVTTDGDGKVTGTLSFGAAGALQISGTVTPAVEAEGLPEGIELTGEAGPAVYKVRGYFVEDSTHIVGTTLSIQSDIAGHPPGTAGPFMLFPAHGEEK